MNDLKVKMTNKGNSKEFSVNATLTKEEAIEVQRVKGFHITGHSFFGYTTQDTSTTWRCYRSCAE